MKKTTTDLVDNEFVAFICTEVNRGRLYTNIAEIDLLVVDLIFKKSDILREFSHQLIKGSVRRFVRRRGKFGGSDKIGVWLNWPAKSGHLGCSLVIVEAQQSGKILQAN